MKTTRYTHKRLEADVARLNETLAARSDKYRFDVGSRYNYSAIDLATPEQLARHCCSRMLVGGTPRECLNACYQYIAEGVRT
jgi:hypothetical protein